MRLHRHDEIVEAMVEAARRHDGLRNSIRAALDAMLEAAVRLEVGEVSDVVSGPKSYVALFLRMEASDDNA
jgi:hypothetical protein